MVVRTGLNTCMGNMVRQLIAPTHLQLEATPFVEVKPLSHAMLSCGLNASHVLRDISCMPAGMAFLAARLSSAKVLCLMAYAVTCHPVRSAQSVLADNRACKDVICSPLYLLSRTRQHSLHCLNDVDIAYIFLCTSSLCYTGPGQFFCFCPHVHHAALCGVCYQSESLPPDGSRRHLHIPGHVLSCRPYWGPCHHAVHWRGVYGQDGGLWNSTEEPWSLQAGSCLYHVLL